ncbi:MAG: HAD family hydrolase [Acidobacteria bacterium]|nr:HAD family hydrolase [Acidobacteriota bacterium]
MQEREHSGANCRRYVILDRDGTLNVEKHYLSDPLEVELLPGVLEGLAHLQALGLGLIVMTNQSAVGRGYFDLERLAQIHSRLEKLLAEGGIILDSIYYCPHRPDENCLCRKPASGLLVRAAGDLKFDPGRAFVIGDQACDILIGKAVGATTILVTTGYGEQTRDELAVQPDFIADSLVHAAEVIENILSSKTDS